MPNAADPLTARALAAYPFRARCWNEGAGEYRRALIAHIEAFDFALAHELRTGRTQAEWTPEDIDAFRRHLLGKQRGSALRDDQPVRGHPVYDGGVHEVSEARLLALAEAGLTSCMETRREHPALVMPILIHVLMADGRLLVSSANREDRVAIIKMVARELPVFGFVVIADVFIHGIPAEGQPGPVSKLDAFAAHVGTRDLRRLMTRPYRVEGGRAIFMEPPPDVDKRGPDIIHDPYAGVFAMAQPSREQ